ncbi:flavin-containing monooxygenase [Rhodococcus opacus]|uniref:flavin-containing monooxygenase n=1 Tax=Rhodococcus opacus TaxID=37919 RepID=UPI001F57FAC2|nr:NAD(P)/FAD-dependent oxidoreductase [Rhodococcus opacus]UNN05320.1 NAD(P)/FAD-dependent oxidoreductase [Rhodococcus opacus]
MSASEARVTATQAGGVLIIGAGFSGLGIAAMLDKSGIRDWIILEQADDVGGTWRDNTYPGCACDIPSPLYSYSFAQNPFWSHLFAPQAEIHGYLKHFAQDRQLTSRIQFGKSVQNLTWNEQARQWEVTTSDGAIYHFTYVVSGVGLLHRPKVPTLPGIENFKGEVFHSAAWNHSYDLSGKRVAVVGTGASAIQFVPAIVDQVESMTVFQRSAPWILPKANRPLDSRYKRLSRVFPPYMWYERAKLYWIHEKRAEGFTNITSDTGKSEHLGRTLLERQVADPELRKKLTPDYAIGCKRLLISNDYYPALAREHVEVATDGVGEFYDEGIVTTSGEKVEADCVIFGTGFDAQNALAEVSIRGRNGIDLNDAWGEGMSAYLGSTISGFPNFFIMCGPNTGLGHNSQVFMIEAQGRYICAVVKHAQRKGGTVEVKRAVHDAFRDWLDGRMESTVWQAGGCTSWYIDSRSGKNTLLWPSTTLDFWRKTRFVRPSDYIFG